MKNKILILSFIFFLALSQNGVFSLDVDQDFVNSLAIINAADKEITKDIYEDFSEEIISQSEESYNTQEKYILENMNMQKHISNIGYKILNANKIDVRMAFVYRSGNSRLTVEPGLIKRQILVYDDNIQFASDDNEIAAFLARQICKSEESYYGMAKGTLTSLQVKCAPKKYEIFFDKRAVDLMVAAGYNPIGLITFLNKSEPQRRYDKISKHNLTSKRLAILYEYIYTKYPYFIKNNEYISNEAYQNFLLISTENRKKLYEKIKTGSKGKINYE